MPEQGADVKVLAGGTLRDRFYAPLEFAEHQPARIWNDRGIGGEQTRLFRWLLEGSGRVRVTYHSPKAKLVAKSVDLP